MAHPLRFGGSEYRIQWLSNAGIINLRNGGFHHIRITGFHDRTDGVKPSGILNNVSPLPCSHPACSKFCVHLEFLPEIVCKVEKVRSTFHTFHNYLNFCRGGKEDRLFNIYI